MKNIIIGIVAAGALIWTFWGYFQMLTDRRFWTTFLPVFVVTNLVTWLLFLVPVLVWLAWDRYRKKK